MTSRPKLDIKNLMRDLEVDKIGFLSLQKNIEDTIVEKTRTLIKEPRSIIVIAMEIFPEVVGFLKSPRTEGELALRDLYRQNQNTVDGRLDWEIYRIVKKLHTMGYKGVPMPSSGPYDERFLEGAFSYRHAAEKAGLGMLGWNGMLLTPEYGPRVRIACVVSDIAIETSPSAGSEKPCIKCQGACIKICPANAIFIPGKNDTYNIDKYLCSTYLAASGMCSECVKVCPAGKKDI